MSNITLNSIFAQALAVASDHPAAKFFPSQMKAIKLAVAQIKHTEDRSRADVKAEADLVKEKEEGADMAEAQSSTPPAPKKKPTPAKRPTNRAAKKTTAPDKVEKPSGKGNK